MRWFKIFYGLFCMAVLLAGVLLLQPGRLLAETPSEPGDNPLLEELGIVDLIKSKAIPKALTKRAANRVRGEALMINRQKGNCLACHRVSAFEVKAKTNPNAYGDMGEVGPSLDGVASRYDPGQLRLLLVDAKQIFPETIMPSFYKIAGLNRVDTAFENKTILDKQEIEDILAFLLTLKDGANK